MQSDMLHQRCVTKWGDGSLFRVIHHSIKWFITKWGVTCHPKVTYSEIRCDVSLFLDIFLECSFLFQAVNTYIYIGCKVGHFVGQLFTWAAKLKHCITKWGGKKSQNNSSDVCGRREQQQQRPSPWTKAVAPLFPLQRCRSQSWCWPASGAKPRWRGWTPARSTPSKCSCWTGRRRSSSWRDDSPVRNVSRGIEQKQREKERWT